VPPPPALPASSLRRTLLRWLILPLVALVPLSAAVVYALAVRPALDGLDRALTDTAVALTGILETHGGQPTLPLSAQTLRALRADLVDEVAFVVGDAQGRPLGGDTALLAAAPVLQAGQWRFFNATLRGRHLRAAAFGARCGEPAQVCTILVAESLGKREAAERAVAWAALAAAVLLALSLGLLSVMAVQRGLRPLQRASVEIGSRSLQRLDPIEAHTVPREVAPFVLALNDLFARLRLAASAQRAFVEDAAHQLRTPLSTLRVESAQALAQACPPELQPTLLRLHAAAERGAHLVQQLLTLARADGAALGAGTPLARIDLAALAAQSADDWLRPALAAGQDLGFDLEPAFVDGDALLLRELLGNLVHNAIEHAGAGSRITVRTRGEPERSLLEVVDDGRGLPADELPQVWDRFRRGAGAGGLGTGLGLAIVRDIARLHGGDAVLRAGAEGRGLAAAVALPRSMHPGPAEPVANLS
jgi:two-component system sensor histidine kinase TctE